MRASTRRWLSALSTAAVTVGLIFGAGVAPATAAGPAVLSVEITPVNPATGETVTSTGYGQHNNRLGYRIAYSCSVAECTDAVVTLPAVDLDPTHNLLRLMRYETWTPPAGGGATITNSETAGVTVRLGNVAAGTSSTFLVQYLRPTDTSAPNPTAPAYFPPGYQIQRSATISSPNAVADVSDAAPAVTWNIAIPNPGIVKTAPATVRPDTDVTYTIGMSDGCFRHLGQNRWVAAGDLLCAESYTVVDELPAQAEFVSASDGGVYDAGSRTVTWTGSGASAAGGWGVASTGTWTRGYGYHNRTVTVRYPVSAFPEGADGADFVTPVTNDVRVDVTYLDDAATTKSATNSMTHSVVRVEPFGRADQTKIGNADQDSFGTRYVNVPPDTTGLICPAGGRDEWNRACTPGQAVAPFATRTDRFWQVDTYNRGNVPGVATVVDEDLGNSSVRVTRITTAGGTGLPTIEWTTTDGTTPETGIVTAASYTAPAGRWITAATVTSGSLAGPNLLPTGTAGTLFRVQFGYDLPVGSELFTWRNTASATMTYPENPEIAPIEVESAGAIIFRETPKAAVIPPTFGAGFVGAPVVEGGGLVVPGGKVTFGVRGATSNIPADRDVSPQYVFIAPEGWTLTPNSAGFPAGSVPPGVSYVYKNVDVAGATRQAVIASWPTGATFGRNATWPTMTVSASPTATVPAGTNSVAITWVGDSRNVFDANATTWNAKVVDTTDVDGDGNVTEAFAAATTTVAVSGTQRLDVIKEICVPDGDGCDWVSNPNIIVGVDPDATDITYRVTLVNGGNTVLTNVVGYDVLPFDGDSRGSTFGETLNAVTEQSPNVTLTYSGSQNPCRAEVLPTNPGCVAEWTADAEGAAAIRAAVDGSLAPGASASFVFTANVIPGAPADAIACNSVAIDSASTLPTEPRPVCATTQEADLQIEVPDRLPLQAGRPGVVPFTVTNLGGSEAAPAAVEILVPAGIRITSLTPAGWVCEAAETEADGSVLGPVALTCDPVDADGTSRMLAIDAPEALALPAVIPDESLVGDETCFPASVSGLMSDPVDENNADTACFAVAAADALIGLTKDDGQDTLRIGDEFTYTIEVANLLVGEALSEVVITDELPDTLAFVSATAGGVIADQGEADADGYRPGGTVSWTLASLASAGELDADGGTTEGAEGSAQTVSVTVRVVQAAEATDEIVNAATATTIDPALPDVTLTASDSDTDALLRTAAIQLLKSATPAQASAAGDEISYSFLVTNSGDVTLTDVGITETDFTGSGAPIEVVCPAEAGSLAPGTTVTCGATYAVTQGDLDAGVVSNTATATGTAPAGLMAPVSAPSTAVVAADVASALTLVKTVTPETAAAAGDKVTYDFVVTNDGDVTVSDVEIVEGEFSGDTAQLSDIVCETAGPLAPGDDVACSATYTMTQADVDAGTVTNTATATADAPGAVADPVSAPSTALLDIPAAPGLEVVKSVSEGTVDSAGDTVTYLFAVTNTGNVTIDAIAIEERAFTGAGEPVEIVCPAASLAPAEEMTCVGTYQVVQADVDAGGIDNTARVTGAAPDASTVVSADSTAAIVIEGEPGLSLVKSASPTTLVVDQELTYSFVVTNTGNITISGVAIEETVFTGSGDLSDVTCIAASSLAPGAQAVCEATYTITQDDVDAGELTNTAIATGSTPQGVVASEASTVELPFDQQPGLSVVKTADSDGFEAVGDEITYGFRVTNTGNVTMSDVAVIEGEFTGAGELSDIACASASLLPGQFVDCSATYSITQADIDAGELSNTATAAALAPGGTEPLVSEPSEVTVPFVGAMGLLLEKAGTAVDGNGDGLVTAGDTIRWTFTATNAGAATLTELAIVDPLAGAVSCEAEILPPGASVNCAAVEYRITSEDASAGRVVNTATATAVGAAGVAVVSAEATAIVEVDAEPSVLAQTGGQIAVWLLVLAALMLLIGAAIIWRNRRRVTS